MAIPGKRSGTNVILSNERNWSELPEDILHLFSKKVHDISDFIRFRAVCKSWQLSAPVTDPPPQLPWLLERRQDFENPENVIIRFYCLSSSKVLTITSPGSSHAWLDGPGCRYLLASHLGKFDRFLLNPLTHDQIHIPSLNIHGSGFLNYIGPDPTKGGDIVVISGVADWDTEPNIMAFWRPMADDWVYVEGIGDCYSGSALYMGQYFSNNEVTGITNVIDIATNKMAYQVPPPEGSKHLLCGRTFIIESGGKILRLFQQYEVFDIYYLHFSDGERKPCWVKITDIGDQMLFVQYDCGLSFCASNFARFKGNCIYYLRYRGGLCRYDIGDGTTEVLPCPFDSVKTWFVPSLV